LVILSFDTATDVATACVSSDGEALAESASSGRSVGAQRLLDDVHRLLERAGVTPGDVELIVAGTGPGTFTGLRIGLATARALGFALGVPVRGVSTLAALRAPDDVDVGCIDARRGEVFCAGPGIEPQAVDPAALAPLLPGGAAVAGDGAVRYREVLIPPDDSALHIPHARHHAALRATAGPPDPCYLRAPDADRSLAVKAAG
jgi:tRNA threonylcarbamoyladenosine biosynthesis protein TsaB